MREICGRLIRLTRRAPVTGCLSPRTGSVSAGATTRAAEPWPSGHVPRPRGSPTRAAVSSRDVGSLRSRRLPWSAPPGAAPGMVRLSSTGLPTCFMHGAIKYPAHTGWAAAKLPRLPQRAMAMVLPVTSTGCYLTGKTMVLPVTSTGFYMLPQCEGWGASTGAGSLDAPLWRRTGATRWSTNTIAMAYQRRNLPLPSPTPSP